MDSGGWGASRGSRLRKRTGLFQSKVRFGCRKNRKMAVDSIVYEHLLTSAKTDLSPKLYDH